MKGGREDPKRFAAAAFAVLLVMACVNPVAALSDSPYGHGTDTGRKLQFYGTAFELGGEIGTTTVGYLIAVVTGAILAVVVYDNRQHLAPQADDFGHILERFPQISLPTWKPASPKIEVNMHHDYGDTSFTLLHPENAEAKAYIQEIENQKNYDDSKRKGIPVEGNQKDNKDSKGNDDFHGIKIITSDSYSSISLFGHPTDKQNGCPKQIRYFGQDGEADTDIDFSHDLEAGKASFPHIHKWINGVRGSSLSDGIDEIIRNWRCKNYDFRNHRWM